MVLQALKWDVSAVTPHDFLEHIVRRLPLTSLDDVDTVRRHAQTFIALCTAGMIQYSEIMRLACHHEVPDAQELAVKLISRGVVRGFTGVDISSRFLSLWQGID